jgi:hypothetical protein
LKKIPVLHPFIIAVFPALAVLSYSIPEISVSELLLPSAIALTLASLMLLSTWLVLRNIHKAALIVSIFLALVYSTAHVFTLTGLLGVDSPWLGWVLLILIWVLLYPYLLYLIARTGKVLRYSTIILNVATVVMLLISGVRIGMYLPQRIDSGVSLPESHADLQLDTSRYQTPPDIYYIILDRYANARTLDEAYDFDNSEFLSQLAAEGFYVANDSNANYVRTSESLASSMNMEYIDYMDEDSSDLLPLNQKMKNNAVQRQLKSAGYKFIQMGSWSGALRKNENADVNINYCARTSLFSEYMLTSTMPCAVCAELGIVDDPNVRHWKRTKFEFEELAKIPTQYSETPIFTFAHFMVSHPPYAFDADGSFLSPEEVSKRGETDSYRSGVIASNEMVLDLVRQLKSTSEVPPIIILQGDEGPYPDRYQAADRSFHWERAADAEIRQKFGILNAYYLPGVDSSSLYPWITPVNSFRLVFDLYFGTSLGLLPDRSYAYVSYSHPYQFLDITEKVKP